jgi:hypothetical protein
VEILEYPVGESDLFHCREPPDKAELA